MSIIKSRCPKCEKLGKDQKGDNLAIYPDGHEYCFACGYFKPQPIQGQLRSLLSGPSHESQPTSIFLSSNTSFTLPPVALGWLRRYRITDKEIHDYKICYDYEKDLLILPIYDGNSLLAYSGRYFGSNPEYPKYLTGGLRRDVFRAFGERQTARSVPRILVEDYVSAVRVARQYPCIPLLRSHFPLSLVFGLLKHTDCIRVWLDFDKARDALKLTNRARQWVPDCDTIITELDPKCYSDEEIRGIVLRSIKSPT